jgi:hypothetical protein
VAPVLGYGGTVELPVAKATVVMRKARDSWMVMWRFLKMGVPLNNPF